MRVLVHDRSGHPFQVQLSRSLARRGHDVCHSFGSFFQSPRGNLERNGDDPKNFIIAGLELRRPFSKYSTMKRLLQEQEYSRVLTDHVRDFSPDVVILSNVPPDAQRYVLKNLRSEKRRFVSWVQDLYGLAIGRILKRRNRLLGAVVGAYYSRIEEQVMRNCDHIVSITEDFVTPLRSWGVEETKITVIPNWAPLEELGISPRDNSWARALGLVEKLCFLYSGTLGMKHNPDLLIQLALHLVPNPKAILVVVSEGPGAEWLKRRQEELKLSNLVILGFQPFGKMPDVLGTADVLLTILESDAGAFSVPSKILTYLCAGKPLLAAMPSQNLGAQIIANKGAGIVVDSDDVRGFLDGADRLSTDSRLRSEFGEHALSYARSNFDIDAITSKFEAILHSLVR